MTLLFSACLAAVYLFQIRRAPSAFRSACKTAAIGALAIAAWPAHPLLALALGLCALGDLALSRSGDRAFLAGVAAFALGHLVYITIFLGHPASSSANIFQAFPLLFTGALLVIAAGAARVLWRPAKDLRVAVLAYIAIIVVMAISAVSLPMTSEFLPIHMGVGLFVTSDLVLATETFLFAQTDRKRQVTGPVIWITYWAAQACLWSGILSLV